MAQTTPDRKAAYVSVSVYPAYAYSPTPRQTRYEDDHHLHGGFDTGYDPAAHRGVADPLPSPTPLLMGASLPGRTVPRRDYKPTALRWWFHLLLIVCLCGFIGLTEYAIRNLANYHDDAIAKIIMARAAEGADGSTGPAEAAPAGESAAAGGGPTSTVVVTTNGNAGVQEATTVTASPTTYFTTDDEAGLATATTIQVGTTPDASAGLHDQTTVTVPMTIGSSAGLQDQTTVTAPVTAGLSDGLQDQTTVTEPPAPTTTDPDAGVETKTTVVSSIAGLTTDGGGLDTATTVYATTTDGRAGLQTTSAARGAGTPSVAVLERTTVLPAGEATTARTTTGADGRATVETLTTAVPARTSVVRESVTLAPGEVLTTVPAVSAVTVGGTTETLATTWTDADGVAHTSARTTVVGGRTSSVTVASVGVVAAATAGAGEGAGAAPGAHGGAAGAEVLSLSEAEYLAGAFLATVLAVLVAFPLGLVGTNAKLMQPFHALATAGAGGGGGAAAEASVFLRFYDWSGALSLPRALARGQPVVALADLVGALAALLSPVAALTVSIHVGDGCMARCFGTLGVSVAPARALQALLAALALLLALLMLAVAFGGGGGGAHGGGRRRGWETGVGRNPWSIAGMASLCRDPELRERLQRLPRGLGGPVDEARVLEILRERRYALGTSGAAGYGVMVVGAGDDTGAQLLRPGDDSGRHRQQQQEPEPEPEPEPEMEMELGSRRRGKMKKCQPFAVLTWWGRCGLLFVFSSVLVMVTYYGNTGIDSGFERFMDSQSLGVKFLFTALGVVLGLSMNTFFRSVAILSPYLQLSRRALPAGRTILLSPPTNALSGLRSAVRQRSPFLGGVALVALLAELCLPVALSHVPFSRFDKRSTETACIWASVAILALMVLVVLASLAVDWPHLPLDPRTVAGAMFYVCDARMLAALEGDGDGDDVGRRRWRYGYGRVHGTGGGERMGVDVCGDDGGEAAEMVPEKKRISTHSSHF